MGWYAPYGKDLKGSSVNESGIHTYTDKILESLVRETIQNSLDVVVDENVPLRMTFNVSKIKSLEIPEREFFLKTAIPGALKRWEHDIAAQDYLHEFESQLMEEYVYILKISDYNTSGLEERQWDALIYDTGSSYKRDEGAGGSFGIGKSAPFAASYFRMLFYETLLKNKEIKSIGVTNFLSYEFNIETNSQEETYTTEGTLYFGSKNREPFYKPIHLGFNNRNEVGTDIYVIGFNNYDNWEENTIKYAIKNFMVSIYDEKMVVEVGNKIIDKESLQKYFKDFENDEDLVVTKKYYDLYKNPETIRVKLDSSFKKYGFNESDGYLLLAEAEQATRKVLMTRKTGMKIYERTHINSVIQFNAIFRAEGKEINRVLREMENPRHDKWSAELLKGEDKIKYKNLLTDLGKFFRGAVNSKLKVDEDKTVDAYGVSDFLPYNSDDNFSEEEIGNNITNLILKQRDITPSFFSVPDFESVSNDWVRGDVGPGGVREEAAGTYNANTKIPFPAINPNSEGSFYINRNFKEIKNRTINFRIVERDYENGEYRLMFSSDLDRELIKFEIKVATETSDTYQGILKSARMGDLELLEKNDIYIENVKLYKDYFVDFKLEEAKRVKLEARVYESK